MGLSVYPLSMSERARLVRATSLALSFVNPPWMGVRSHHEAKAKAPMLPAPGAASGVMTNKRTTSRISKSVRDEEAEVATRVAAVSTTTTTTGRSTKCRCAPWSVNEACVAESERSLFFVSTLPYQVLDCGEQSSVSAAASRSHPFTRAPRRWSSLTKLLRGRWLPWRQISLVPVSMHAAA